MNKPFRGSASASLFLRVMSLSTSFVDTRYRVNVRVSRSHHGRVHTLTSPYSQSVVNHIRLGVVVCGEPL